MSDENNDVRDVEIESVTQDEMRSGRGAACKYPWKTMNPGEAIFFPSHEEEPKPWKSRTSMTAWLNRRYADDGWRFVTRKCLAKDGRLGARIIRQC